MTLGATLKKRRGELGLSLREVEKRTDSGISNGYLSLLESDLVKQPSPRHLHMLSSVLELSYARLIELAGYVVPDSSHQGVAAQGTAFAGWEDLTPDERHMVEDLVKQQVRSLREFRERNKAPG